MAVTLSVRRGLQEDREGDKEEGDREVMMAGDGGEERKFRDSPPVGHEELEEVAENGLWQRWNESERESS